MLERTHAALDGTHPRVIASIASREQLPPQHVDVETRRVEGSRVVGDLGVAHAIAASTPMPTRPSAMPCTRATVVHAFSSGRMRARDVAMPAKGCT